MQGSQERLYKEMMPEPDLERQICQREDDGPLRRNGGVEALKGGLFKLL